MCFSVFAAENLNLRFSFYESETGPGPPWLILCEKTDVNFSLLINDWSFGKECGSNVSSRLLGRSVT